MIKGFSIDGEVVHENFHDLLNHVRENRHHAPLERSGCTTQPEQHPMIGVRSIRACERGLTLVIRVGGDLVITGIPIKEIEEGMVCKPLQHFINEGQRETILLCSLIEFPIIYAHPPPSKGGLGTTVNPPFLDTT